MSQAIAPFVFHQGTAPLLISMPHTGTHVPADIAARLTPEGREVHDTDWHMPQLYDFAKALGASMLVATHSRYVIDLNRPPDGASLYPGQSVTGLCPVDGFDSKPLYASKDLEPDEAEVARRRELYWQPYHTQLRAELDRIQHEYNTIRLHSAIGYVTPEDEHQGRGEAIRAARRKGLHDAAQRRLAHHRHQRNNQIHNHRPNPHGVD